MRGREGGFRVREFFVGGGSCLVHPAPGGRVSRVACIGRGVARGRGGEVGVKVGG